MSLLPMHKECGHLEDRVEAIVAEGGAHGVTLDYLCTAYEEHHTERLRDAARRCGFGNVREMLEMQQGLRVGGIGPDTVYHLRKPRAKPAASAAPPATPAPDAAVMEKLARFPGLKEMLASLRPALDDKEYVYATVPRGDMTLDALQHVLSYHVEDEGCSLVLPRDLAARVLPPSAKTEFPCVKITLTVLSALDAVGLTAAVADALGRRGIPCNVVAAYHHDHIFVPVAQGPSAMATLLRLQQQCEAP